MANHEGRRKYARQLRHGAGGCKLPRAAQKSGISRRNSDALFRGVRSPFPLRHAGLPAPLARSNASDEAPAGDAGDSWLGISGVRGLISRT